MRAKELVPILAEIYGVPFVAAGMIDRSLAEAGLRAKGRGKALPEMTRREALIFLIACMATQKASRAGDEVKPWLSAHGLVVEPISDGHNHYMQEILDRMGYQPTGDDGFPSSINMVDCLLAACGVLEASNIDGHLLKFELCFSHGWASVVVDEAFSGGRSEIYFLAHDDADDPAIHETQIMKTAVIHGDALLALAARTPRQEGDS